MARAAGLLVPEEQQAEASLTTLFIYPRNVVFPRDRHDNDKMDIADIKIFPTQEEILSDAAEFLPSSGVDQAHFLTDKA
jgi:hypothetical protein